MPLFHYKCLKCKSEISSLKRIQICDCGEPLRPQLASPQAKYMEKVGNRGKSRMKGQEKILKARARAHSRDNELADLVATNPRENAIANRWLSEDGKSLRKKIDDK